MSERAIINDKSRIREDINVCSTNETILSLNLTSFQVKI